MSSRARARVRDRARARENEALIGSREERAGEAGLPLLVLLTLILLLSSKMWDGTVKYFVVPGGHLSHIACFRAVCQFPSHATYLTIPTF
jgi:hypothetical protein